MKLLVGGDSFAEFSHYRGHFKTISPSFKQGCNGEDTTFEHWCELVAYNSKGKATTCGIGGGDVSSTSFLTMKYLLEDESYTHVLFFVSHHYRTLLTDIESKEAWKIYADPELLNIEGPKTNFYFTHDIHSKLSNSGINTEEIPYRYVPANAEHIVRNNTSEIEKDILVKKPLHSYVHDHLSNLFLLNEFCRTRDIRIIFVKVFPAGLLDLANQLNLGLDSFDVCEIEKEWKLECIHDFPSHYNRQAHKIIYREFKNQYPKWGKEQ